MNEKLENLLTDESFLAKLESVESPDEFLALFQGEGLTEEETKEALAAFEKLATEQGEIGEEDLESVAGGRINFNPNPGPIPKTPPIPYTNRSKLWLYRVITQTRKWMRLDFS